MHLRADLIHTTYKRLGVAQDAPLSAWDDWDIEFSSGDVIAVLQVAVGLPNFAKRTMIQA